MEGGPQEKGVVCIKLQRPEQENNVEGQEEADLNTAQGRNEKELDVIYDQIVGTLRTIERFSFLSFKKNFFESVSVGP